MKVAKRGKNISKDDVDDKSPAGHQKLYLCHNECTEKNFFPKKRVFI